MTRMEVILREKPLSRLVELIKSDHAMIQVIRSIFDMLILSFIEDDSLCSLY